MTLFPKNKPFLKTIAFVSSYALLAGCVLETDDENVTSSEHYAVITTNEGNDSSNISIVSLSDFSVDNTNYATGSTDTSVATHGEFFYHLARTPEGVVTKFSINEPDADLSQHKAQETNEDSSNPHKLVIKNETTGYLIRYGKSEIWIVNPSANNDEVYKTGEIDLSTYAGDDGTPEATDALLIDNKLYVLMQNLDRNNGWTPGTAYLAIFDTGNNNIELETNTDANTPKGIELSVKNPNEMDYLESNNTIYIAGLGPYFPVDFSGGVESVNISDYSTNVVIDRSDTEQQFFGQTKHVAILNSTRGYIVGYAAWKDTGVYSFNPSTGIVDTQALFINKDISDIEIGPLGNLWVANRSDSGINIVDTVDNTISEQLIETNLLPNDIEFISIPK